MKRPSRIALVLLGLLVCHGVARAAEVYKSAAGPYAVETALYDWVDDTRHRTVPVKVYFPKTGDGPLPVIIFSHGLGGSREGYAYLGRHWAGHGYVSVHLQHKGSDREVWGGQGGPTQSMRESVANLDNAINRPRDVSFAVDRLSAMNGETGPLKGRLDLGRLGMAGHSFGAWTTMAVAGQSFAGGRVAIGDSRFKAAIPMSASPPPRRNRLDAVYAGVGIPCFHMTGTLDASPLNDLAPKDRRVPFDHIRGADQYLVTFAGGDHMVFSGRGSRPGEAGGGADGSPATGAGPSDAQALRDAFQREGRTDLGWVSGDRAKDPRFHDLIRQGTTAFWDAYLKGDSAAMKWLAEGGFEAALGADGVFEKKLKGSPAAK